MLKGLKYGKMKQKSAILERKHSKGAVRATTHQMRWDRYSIGNTHESANQTWWKRCRRQPISVRKRRVYGFQCKRGLCWCIGGLLPVCAPADPQSASCTQTPRLTAAAACETLPTKSSRRQMGSWELLWTEREAPARFPASSCPPRSMSRERLPRARVCTLGSKAKAWRRSCQGAQVVRAVRSLGFSAASGTPGLLFSQFYRREGKNCFNI